jgi:hypothetical protein
MGCNTDRRNSLAFAAPTLGCRTWPGNRFALGNIEFSIEFAQQPGLPATGRSL